MQNMSMDPQAGANESNTALNPTTPTMTSTAPSDAPKEMEAATHRLRHLVEELIITDQRFTGMSRYVYDVNFYWSYMIPTACAGHGFIFFNPTFYEHLTHEERKTVIAHEIWHLILDHIRRSEGYDPELHNKAADYVINWTLKQDGFITDNSPNQFAGIGILIDSQYHGWSTTQVYYDLLAKQKNQKEKPSGQSSNGQPIEGNLSNSQIEDLVKEAIKVEGTNKSLSEQIQDNNEKRKEAVKNQKSCGSGSGHEDILIQHDNALIFVKEATYQEIFEDYLTDPLSGGKRTFMRPSRLQGSTNLRMKGKYPKRGRKNRLKHMVYALDVSGSISSVQAKQFLKSANSIKRILNPEFMTVMLWDTQIKFEKTFGENDDLNNIRVQAGGGTNLYPVYERCKTLEPEAVVIFTDLCVQIPPQPEWESIWFVTSKHDVQYQQSNLYGDVYLIPEEDR